MKNQAELYKTLKIIQSQIAGIRSYLNTNLVQIDEYNKCNKKLVYLLSEEDRLRKLIKGGIKYGNKY